MDHINRFIYLHIMKTAGTSISTQIKRIYNDDYILDHSYRQARRALDGVFIFDKSERMYPKSYKKYKVIHGHFTFKKYEHLGWPIITFLREPVSRVQSQFFSVQNFARKPLPLEQFCMRTANTMTKMTGGDLSRFNFVGIVSKLPESLNRLGELLRQNFKNIKKNITHNKRKLTPKEVIIIKKHNQEDIKLYREALKRFNRGT